MFREGGGYGSGERSYGDSSERYHPRSDDYPERRAQRDYRDSSERYHPRRDDYFERRAQRDYRDSSERYHPRRDDYSERRAQRDYRDSSERYHPRRDDYPERRAQRDYRDSSERYHPRRDDYFERRAQRDYRDSSERYHPRRDDYPERRAQRDYRDSSERYHPRRDDYFERRAQRDYRDSCEINPPRRDDSRERRSSRSYVGGGFGRILPQGEESRMFSPEPDPLRNYQGSEIFNGITREEVFPRSALIKKITEFISERDHRLIVISSPRATGKTSLLQILRDVQPINAKYKYVIFKEDMDPYDVLRNVRIEWEEERWKYPETWDKFGKIILIIDDAQNSYSSGFFQSVFKGAGGFPEKFCIIVASTYLLSGGDSPIELALCRARISLSDLLLSPAEAESLLLSAPPVGLAENLRSFNELVMKIVSDCNGHIGSLRMTARAMNTQNHNVPFTQEADAVQFFLKMDEPTIFSRCWDFTIQAETRNLIEQYVTSLMCNEGLYVPTEQINQELKNLIKAGILSSSPSTPPLIKFTSPLAKRYFSRKYFTDRANIKETLSLEQLAVEAIRRMPAHALSNSVIIDGDGTFPKEATFQQLFFKSLLLLTTFDIKILPELSTIPISARTNSSGKKIKGEIDFLVMDSFIWGIELAVLGRKIGEHITRFGPGGKYFGLGLSDYIIIDFRWGSPSSRHVRAPKKMEVYFNSNDYKQCICTYGGSDTTYEVFLS